MAGSRLPLAGNDDKYGLRSFIEYSADTDHAGGNGTRQQGDVKGLEEYLVTYGPLLGKQAERSLEPLSQTSTSPLRPASAIACRALATERPTVASSFRHGRTTDTSTGNGLTTTARAS